jgi:spermidine synthase
MKPWELLGEARMPDGTDMKLQRRDKEHVIFAGGKILMSSRMHGSEEALAGFACESARAVDAPCVLIGGLGMGFTLRATLNLLSEAASVVVAELQPAVIAWNRGPLGPLADHPLRDRRVRIEERDVGLALRGSSAKYDAVILDVDNGPDAFTTSTNARLYSDAGLASIRAALKPGGVLAVWSAWEDRKFEQRLRYGGFRVRVERVRARLKRGGPRHTIFLATSSDSDTAPRGRSSPSG